MILEYPKKLLLKWVYIHESHCLLCLSFFIVTAATSSMGDALEEMEQQLQERNATISRLKQELAQFKEPKRKTVS